MASRLQNCRRSDFRRTIPDLEYSNNVHPWWHVECGLHALCGPWANVRYEYVIDPVVADDNWASWTGEIDPKISRRLLDRERAVGAEFGRFAIWCSRRPNNKAAVAILGERKFCVENRRAIHTCGHFDPSYESLSLAGSRGVRGVVEKDFDSESCAWSAVERSVNR